MSNNKKIVNATRNTYDGICFKSLLEKVVYSTLSQLGYNPQYEPQTFTLFEGFVPITPFYDKMSDSKVKKALLKYKMLAQSPNPSVSGITQAVFPQAAAHRL